MKSKAQNNTRKNTEHFHVCQASQTATRRRRWQNKEEEKKIHRHSLASGTIALHTQHANARLAVYRHTIPCNVCTASIYQTVFVSFFVRSIFIPLNFLNCFIFCRFCVYVCFRFAVFFFSPSLGSASSSSSSQTHMCIHKREYMYFVVIRLYYFFSSSSFSPCSWLVCSCFIYIFFFFASFVHY